MSYPPPRQPYGQPAYVQPGYGAQPYGAPPSGPYGAPPNNAPSAYGQPGAYPPGPGGAQLPPAPQYQFPPGSAPGAYRPGAPAAPSPYGVPPGQPPVPGYGAPPATGYGAPPGAPGPYGAPGYGAAPMPPPGVPPEAFAWFQAVDQDRSGRISANELQNALLNGNNTQFKLETIRIVMRLFDTNRNGTIDVNEFYGVLKYINEWKATFDRFDTNRSGYLGPNEVITALRSFGYQLSTQFGDMIVRVMGSRTRPGTLELDGFILASVTLKSMTDKFALFDTARNGTATFSYEQFLSAIFESVLV